MATKYNQIVQDHWRTMQPDRYRALEDPETFFRELGEQIETQVGVWLAAEQECGA